MLSVEQTDDKNEDDEMMNYADVESE